ncbi:MAG: glycoside hydrolase family 2 protein [Verrucomicrobiota bacterium]
MKSDNPIQENLTRRQFLAQAAIVSGALATPVNLSSQTEPAASNEVVAATELLQGWSLKGFEPRAEATAALLNEAERAAVADGWLPVAALPAMVPDVLLAHAKIEPPWLPGGTEKCFWMGQRDWVYALKFSARPGRASRLRFLGLDGRAEVYLNGNRLASHSEEHAPLTVEVSQALRPENSLVLRFRSNAGRSEEGVPEIGRQRPGGSYLGPNPPLASVGIFDHVWLETSDGNTLDEAVAGVSLDESLSTGTLTVDASGNARLPSVSVRVRLFDPEGKPVAESITSAETTAGSFNCRCVVKLDRPQLWWPRGYGRQPLYRAQVTLLAGDRPQQTRHRTIGFRRLTMPEPLHFVVNGVPVLLRGGDWVTPNLMSRVWDQARTEKLFALAENANFNAFRIWGQVMAPHDNFYEMADARGFLLWQDFAQLPLKPDEASRARSREKATRQLKRLKHHASILCWCGCNEAAMWAHEDYNKDFTDHGPWPGLAAAEEVGAICRQFDPERYYQPSSPYGGVNANDPREGNTHGYTNMWFVPGYDYLNFASEDTRIAAPVLHSLKRFMKPEHLWPEGYSTLYLHGNRHPFPKTWLPYTCAESWKKTGPVEQFYDATDLAGLVYRLGMAEGLYYQDTVERQRRGRPAEEASDRRCCGGYIVWKYNDSWPQVYSAKVDFFLEPYHAYYALRRAYAAVLLSFDIGTFIHLWAVNDSTETVSGTVRIQLYHLEQNKFRKEIVREVTVAPGKSAVVVRLDQAGIRAFRKEHILFATLSDQSGKVLARANAFADIERRLVFPEAKLNVQVQNGVLVITTDKFARAVHLEGDAGGNPFGWFFEDNYFDLLPGETKTVRILGRHPQGRIIARAWYSPQATAVDWKKT